MVDYTAGKGSVRRTSSGTSASISSRHGSSCSSTNVAPPALGGNEFLQDAEALQSFLNEWEPEWTLSFSQGVCSGTAVLPSQAQPHGLYLRYRDSSSNSALAEPLIDRRNAWTHPSAKSKTVPDQATSVGASPKVGKPRASSNTWWKRQRKELLDLRVTAKELALGLQQLKLDRGINSTLPLDEPFRVASEKRPGQSIISTTCDASWRAIATRESLVRQTAEVENARLRTIITSQTAYARKLQRTLWQAIRTSRQVETMDIPRSVPCLEAQRVPEDNGVVFARLLDGLDESYANAENLFKGSEITELPCPGQAGNTWVDSIQGLKAQVFDRYQVPFDDESTARAVWEVMTKRTIPASRVMYAEYFDVDENTRLVAQRATYKSELVDAVLLLRVAVRKYVESDRTVYIQHRSILVSLGTRLSVSFDEVTTRILHQGELQTHVLGASPNFCDARNFLPDSLRGWQQSLVDFSHFVEDLVLTTSHNVKEKR